MMFNSIFLWLLSCLLYPKTSGEDKRDEEEEEEFYNGEEYSYEYEVGYCCSEWLICELWETSV